MRWLGRDPNIWRLLPVALVSRCDHHGDLHPNRGDGTDSPGQFLARVRKYLSSVSHLRSTVNQELRDRLKSLWLVAAHHTDINAGEQSILHIVL